MLQCPECGAGADLTADKTYAHCASCRLSSVLFLYFALPDSDTSNLGNNIFEPGKEGSSEKGSGSGSGDKVDSKVDKDSNQKAGEKAKF